MPIQMSQSPRWHFQIGRFVRPTVPKHKDKKFTVIYDIEKQQILTF